MLPPYLLPGKINFGKILYEISGQYFYQGFKPRDRIFPTFFKKSPISSSHCLIIKYKPKFYSALCAEFPFYPSKPRGDRIFTPIFKLGDRIFTPIFKLGERFFPGRIFPKVNFPGQNPPPVSSPGLPAFDCPMLSIGFCADIPARYIADDHFWSRLEQAVHRFVPWFFSEL
jgi:hypothetical protein